MERMSTWQFLILLYNQRIPITTEYVLLDQNNRTSKHSLRVVSLRESPFSLTVKPTCWNKHRHSDSYVPVVLTNLSPKLLKFHIWLGHVGPRTSDKQDWWCEGCRKIWPRFSNPGTHSSSWANLQQNFELAPVGRLAANDHHQNIFKCASKLTCKVFRSSLHPVNIVMRTFNWALFSITVGSKLSTFSNL